jgi:hypothetical protein
MLRVVTIIVALTLLAAPLAAEAQPRGKSPSSACSGRITRQLTLPPEPAEPYIPIPSASLPTSGESTDRGARVRDG